VIPIDPDAVTWSVTVVVAADPDWIVVAVLWSLR
jgi:hypothetical protein